jgi:hypothetical protein
MRRTVAESTGMSSPLGFWLRQAGYSTGAVAQAMRDSAPKFWYEIFAQSDKNVSRETFWYD